MWRMIEQRGEVALWCYGSSRYPGWAVFIYKPDKEGDWKSVKNGKWADVWPKYQELIK